MDEFLSRISDMRVMKGNFTMNGKRFSESEIFKILKEAENGRRVVDLCREYGIGNATFYKWRAKYSGMDASDDL